MKLADLVPWLCSKSRSYLVKIRIHDAGDDGDEVDVIIDQLPAVLGRSETAGVRLTDLWVSKVHCCLTVVDGCLFVRDLESRNGTAVNCERVHERKLNPRDTITLGTSEIELLYVAGRKRILDSQHPAESDATHD